MTVIEFYVVALHLKCFQLRKTIVGYQYLFDYITFEKIISKQTNFVSDRTKLPQNPLRCDCNGKCIG